MGPRIPIRPVIAFFLATVPLLAPASPRSATMPALLQRDPALGLPKNERACGPVVAAGGLLWLARERGFAALVPGSARAAGAAGRLARGLAAQMRSADPARYADGSVGVDGFINGLRGYFRARGVTGYEIEVQGLYNFLIHGTRNPTPGETEPSPRPIGPAQLRRWLDEPDTVVWLNVLWRDQVHSNARTIRFDDGHFVTLVDYVAGGASPPAFLVHDPAPGNHDGPRRFVELVPSTSTATFEIEAGAGQPRFPFPARGTLPYRDGYFIQAIVLRMTPGGVR